MCRQCVFVSSTLICKDPLSLSKFSAQNFDGIELHPIFLQILMDFDWNQPIRVQFKVHIICLSKQKHMVKKVGKKCQDRGKMSKTKTIWTNGLIEKIIELDETRENTWNILCCFVHPFVQCIVLGELHFLLFFLTTSF